MPRPPLSLVFSVSAPFSLSLLVLGSAGPFYPPLLDLFFLASDDGRGAAAIARTHARGPKELLCI
jgi:hypothetical protein